MPSAALANPQPTAPCRFAFWLCLSAGFTLMPQLLPAAAANEPARSSSTAARIVTLQDRVDEMRVQLALDHPVTVHIVPENPRLVSVETASQDAASFRMSFERRFLEGLSDEEIAAVIAHELGHVYLFTHHPYLQTEELANRIAMRVVSRESLTQVYEKVWSRIGRKGDLGAFLGN